VRKRKTEQDIEAQLADYENQLRAQFVQEAREVAAD
jgi:F0F1-type ATP synthase membrane subunit b/b'